MRVLVVGSGAREHALAWKLSSSPELTALHAAPGNPGIGALAELHDVAVTDLEGLTALAQRIEADLVVIGPEVPLVAGLTDRLNAAGIPAFGPDMAAAELEGSKAFAKAGDGRHRRADRAVLGVRHDGRGRGCDRRVRRPGGDQGRRARRRQGRGGVLVGQRGQRRGPRLPGERSLRERPGRGWSWRSA